MIEKAMHARLEAKWAKIHAPYQRWNRLKTRMPLFLKYVDSFNDKDVLELGCNAGIYGYEIAKRAKTYIGVDQGDCYIKQAQITKKDLDMKNATFVAKRVKSFIRDRQKSKDAIPNINALFATFVLYHLSDKETDLIGSEIFPNCDTVLIMTRTSKRSPWKKYNSRKLQKIENVEKYLKEYGFSVKSEMHPSGKFGITKGVKNVDDKREREGNTKGADKSAGRRSTSGVSKRRVREGSQVLSSGRQADAKGTDGVLPQVQAGVGPESDVQGGQRKVLSRKQEGGDERVEEQKKTGAIRGDTEVTKTSESETQPEVQGETDTNVGVGDKDTAHKLPEEDS